MKKLILTIERPISAHSPLAKCLDVVSYATGTYNSDWDGSPYTTGKKLWKNYIDECVKANREVFDKPKIDKELGLKRDYFLYGYGGSHFFLQDLNGNRVLTVTPTEL